jgi:hypothetical protein
MECRTVGSVCDSRAKYFFELSTHTIVYLPSRVQSRDIPTGLKSCLQRDGANFSEVATGVGVHCAAEAVRTIRSNKNPGIAAGVLHFLKIA